MSGILDVTRFRRKSEALVETSPQRVAVAKEGSEELSVVLSLEVPHPAVVLRELQLPRHFYAVVMIGCVAANLAQT